MQSKLLLKNIGYSPKRTTALVLRGTLVATLLLGSLLLAYNGIIRSAWLEGGTWVVICIFAYLFCAEFLLRKNHNYIVNWMLIAFYMLVSFSTLLLWGLNAPVGILTVSFAVILPSILLGARSILPVAAFAVITLIFIQSVHSREIISPSIQHLTQSSTYWDVATYSTILSIFALVSWLAGSQREKNLKRALLAESALRSQKDALRVELDKESASLRLAQLNQVRQLHKFALLGQSSAATLHELSNHLSILNLDIDDLRQHHSNSEAISNAKISIDHINKMVRQARQQINSYEQREDFNAIDIIRTSVQDHSLKHKNSHVKIIKKFATHRRSFNISGNPQALMQIIDILLNNAVDACKDATKPEVHVELALTLKELAISIIDNGPGVDLEIQKSLFTPVTSAKSNGLGVGLYIAKHLAKDQFNAKLNLQPSKTGAHFKIVIPKKVDLSSLGT